MASLLSFLPDLLRRRRRGALLGQAASWPLVEASLLKSVVVEIDSIAEGGTTIQDRQIESAFYFTLENHPGGSYFGGHLRSVPMSDSEAHRAIRTLPEDARLRVRYNPANPDTSVALPNDNPGFQVPIWPA